MRNSLGIYTEPNQPFSLAKCEFGGVKIYQIRFCVMPSFHEIMRLFGNYLPNFCMENHRWRWKIKKYLFLQVLKEGRIIQAGKYDDLLQSGTDFETLVSAHHEAIEAMDIPNHSSEDSEEGLIEDGSFAHTKIRNGSGNNIDMLAKEVQEGASSSEQKAIKEKKKKAKRSRKKQLVQEEERERGKISMTVYLSYMAAAYKGLLIPLIIIAQALFQFLQIGSSWWMAWANPQTDGDEAKVTPTVLLLVYMALAFGSSWFIFVRAVLVATFGLAAAQKLFLKMLRSIFRAPMSFFDSTPAGRILNRVSLLYQHDSITVLLVLGSICWINVLIYPLEAELFQFPKDLLAYKLSCRYLLIKALLILIFPLDSVGLLQQRYNLLVLLR